MWFYRNAKKTNGIEYITVVNNKITDILICFEIQKKNIYNFSIQNKELSNKSYEIIIGDLPIYYGIIENNKNLFPINNFPLSEINLHRIFILIKDIGIPDIELKVSNILIDFSAKSTMKKEFKLSEDKKFICNKYPFPSQNCNICKKKYLHKNYLLVGYGMAGLEYTCNCNDCEIISIEKKILNTNSEKISISLAKINCNKDNLSLYSHNRFLINKLKNYTYDGIMENIEVNLINTDNNLFEYSLIADACFNLEFNCIDNEIEKVTYFTTDGKNVDTEIQIEKTNTGYKIKNNMALLSIILLNYIKVYTINNNPISIKYDIIAFNGDLREKLAKIGRYDIMIE